MASRRFLAALTIGCSLAAGAALAQPMPPNPGPDRPGPMAGGPGGMMGMMGPPHHHHGPPPPDPAAHFRFRRGDAEIDIHCAVQEPMRACIEAASALLDKVQSLAPQPQPQR